MGAEFYRKHYLF